jgi:hypothetical protein
LGLASPPLRAKLAEPPPQRTAYRWLALPPLPAKPAETSPQCSLRSSYRWLASPLPRASPGSHPLKEKLAAGSRRAIIGLQRPLHWQSQRSLPARRVAFARFESPAQSRFARHRGLRAGGIRSSRPRHLFREWDPGLPSHHRRLGPSRVSNRT